MRREPSGSHGSSSANSYFLSSFSEYFLHLLAPLETCLFPGIFSCSSYFFHVPGNIKPASKIWCGISVFFASSPSHSLFFLTKILWLWMSYQLTILPITSSCCSHPPDFNSWLTATLFNTITALILRSKSKWMILPIFQPLNTFTSSPLWSCLSLYTSHSFL